MSDLFETTADRSVTAKRDEATAASDARDWPRAAALWDELRTAQPQDPHWWLKAGEAYSEGRVLDRAEDILGEAVVRFPDHCWIAYRYAVLARYAGDFREGLGRIEKLWRAAPDFWPAWVEYPDALARVGNRDEAEAIRRQAAERFPNEYWPNYAVAQLEAEHSDPRGALRIWLTLAERFPGQPATAAALKAASDAAEDERRAAAPDARSADPGTRGLTERLFQRSRRRSPGRHS
jgi:tetratricopeptide (TPR) repeat protein